MFPADPEDPTNFTDLDNIQPDTPLLPPLSYQWQQTLTHANLMVILYTQHQTVGSVLNQAVNDPKLSGNML